MRILLSELSRRRLSTTSIHCADMHRARFRYATTKLCSSHKDWSDEKATGKKQIIKKASTAQSASNTEFCRHSSTNHSIRAAALASSTSRVVGSGNSARHIGRPISALEAANSRKIVGRGAGRCRPSTRARGSEHSQFADDGKNGEANRDLDRRFERPF